MQHDATHTKSISITGLKSTVTDRGWQIAILPTMPITRTHGGLHAPMEFLRNHTRAGVAVLGSLVSREVGFAQRVVLAKVVVPKPLARIEGIVEDGKYEIRRALVEIQFRSLELPYLDLRKPFGY